MRSPLLSPSPWLGQSLPVSWQSSVRQTQLPVSGVWAYRSSLFVLSSSLTSPKEMGAESDSESVLTLGASDSMARPLTSVR